MIREVPKEATGYHDSHGIPICVGDLIRVFHFVHYRNKRTMYMYFRVAKIDGKYVAQNWNDLDATKYQCLLEHCGLCDSDVLASDGNDFDAKGNLITFNERIRK
jgi:hypothetical protein